MEKLKRNHMKSQLLSQFYKKPVPLSIQTHAGLIVGPGTLGFGFVEDVQTVTLSAVEFSDAGRYYPIVFAAIAEGHFMSVALLGLKKNENLFVDANST